MSSSPSFRRRLLDLRRNVDDLRVLDPAVRHPLLQIPRKLRNYGLAASHGVRIPDVLGVWGRVEDLDLSVLPEEFVLKSDGGAGGRGVLPLRRLGEGRWQAIAGKRVFSQRDIVEHYLGAGSVSGPFFAERLLAQRAGGELPNDVKFYMFYGEVGHVLLRRMEEHANMRRAHYRFLDRDGEDLGADASPRHRVDPTIAVPERLAELLQIARHLSRAVALPFIRVDVYDAVVGPVFGELTRGPGGRQTYRPDHDELLGQLWEDAQRRLELDVLAGRPFGNLHGPQPTPQLYPAAAPDQPGNPGQWPVFTVRCSQWCVPNGTGATAPASTAPSDRRRWRSRWRLSMTKDHTAGPAIPRGEAPPGPAAAPKPADGEARPRGRLGKEVKQLQQTVQRTGETLQAVTAERDGLRQERLRVQQVLGEQHGRRVLPRLRVEKTNGIPSFVVGARMMQRVYRRASDPEAGIDGLGLVFDDPQETARFAHSHGVPVSQQRAGIVDRLEPEVVVHAFRGEVGLVEVRGPGGVRHFEADGTDPGDIRPASTYDSQLERPAALATICSWSATLSSHIPRPYVQLWWTQQDGSAELVRIEIDPDRIPVLTADWDRRLGSVFDGAYSRFLLQPYHGGGLANRVPGGIFENRKRQ